MTRPPLASCLLHRGIYSQQELLLDIWQCWHPTSPILLIICSQSCRGGGLQGRSVGYPSCHSNVSTVRAVADLVWKVFLVIKISLEGWVLISEKLRVFPQLSCCLPACCHVWTTPQAWWNQGTQLASAIMRKSCDDEGTDIRRPWSSSLPRRTPLCRPQLIIQDWKTLIIRQFNRILEAVVWRMLSKSNTMVPVF